MSVPSLSRREFSTSLLALTGATLAGCRPDKTPAGETGDGHTGAAPDDSAPDSGDSAIDTASVPWASGGTASMSGDYADPFGDTVDTSCALMCGMTLGPCYALTPERKDVSEGVSGLPMRLALRVVDESCAPVVGALVEIWHTSPSGLYSGEDAVDMCTTNDSEAEAGHWFRGGQVTDASGRVDFDSCFPGWYGGRTIHIHLQILIGEAQYLVSQLFFDQAFTDEIFATHPEYVGFGAPNTTNSTDGVLAGTDPTPYLAATSKLADGALMAYKTIVIRADPTSELCQVGGG